MTHRRAEILLRKAESLLKIALIERDRRRVGVEKGYFSAEELELAEENVIVRQADRDLAALDLGEATG